MKLPAGLAMILGLAMAVPAAAQDEPPSLPMGGTVTYVGNEGVVIAYGDAKVMIDALYDDGLGDYQETPPLVRNMLMGGVVPYDGVTDVFVTHAHADHYSAETLSQYLAAHPDVYALVPADLSVITEDGEQPAQPVLKQVVPLAGRDNEASPLNDGPNFDWRYFQIPHAGRQHFAFWLSLPPYAGYEAEGVTPQHMTVLHLGDTDDYPSDLEPFRDILAEHPVDVALVPFWLMDEPGLADMLNARQIVGIHVPVAGSAMLDPDTMDWFAEPGESRIIYKNMEE